MLKVSIITVCYNSAETIEYAIKSVLDQVYPDIEYIIIDGGSTDGTLDIIKKYKDKISKFVSEPDKGMYDALNKGLRLATGDIVGVMHSDDFYPSSDIISVVVKKMEETGSEALWGDLQYVDDKDISKVVRDWKSSPYAPGKFKNGWMPPHPTFFAKRELYSKYGGFLIDIPTAADYELVLRFLEKFKVCGVYLPKVLVKMRVGGLSNKSIYNRLRALKDDYRAWKINGLKINPLRILLKPISKIFQFLK